MDHDDRLSLAENFAGSDSDDDEIDSDLEGKLYAAVFHSNDISSRSHEAPKHRNIESLTDVIDSWKNKPVEISLQTEQNSDGNVTTNITQHHTKDIDFNFIPGGDPPVGKNNHDEDVICGSGNLSDVSKCLEYSDKLIEYHKCSGNGESSKVLADNDQGIYDESGKEIVDEPETVPTKYMVKDCRDNIINNKKNSFDIKIMKKHKISPRKLTTSKEFNSNNSSLKSPERSESVNDTDNCAGNHLRDELAKVSTPDKVNESSDIKVEDKLGSLVTENQIFSSHESCALEGGSNRPSSIKPEEELEESLSMDCEVVQKEQNQVSDVKPEEETMKKIQPMENEVSTNPTSLDSSSGESSSSSSEDESQGTKSAEKSKTISHIRNERNEVIILDDSEDSIFEVPVPPKPRPPTINLEDSDNSSSSDSDTSSETMSPKKLVESYKLAISESNSMTQKARRNTDSTELDKAKHNKAPCVSDSSTSDTDGSMTESEEENWGIIAGNQVNNSKPIQNSGTDEIIENLSREDSGCTIIEDVEENTNSIAKENQSSIQESRQKAHSEISLDSVPAINEQSVTLADNIEKEKTNKMDETLAEDDVIIINADSVPNLLSIEEIIEPATPTRTTESRKRSMTNSEKKRKPHNSPKKAKSSEESSGVGISSSKTQQENQENNNKRRNTAADYFFTPMTNEMKNYYNNSWGGENFDLNAIRRQMPRDPEHWAILNEDIIGCQQRRSRYWTESKCRNCNRPGHMMVECPEKKKVPCCHMCGASGHREPRCPHKMCLGCGQKQKSFMQVCNGCRRAQCASCRSYGHVESNCPDLWRRYHLTTSSGNLNTPLKVTDVMKPQHMLSCCNCARRGHDSTTCNNYRWSRHFPTPAYVTNYNTGPTYPEDPGLEEVEVPSKATAPTETETRYTNRNVLPKSPASNEAKKKKSKTDKMSSQHVQTENVIRTTSEVVDEILDKSKELRKSDKDKAQKIDNVSLTNSDSTNSETSLILTSNCVEDEVEPSSDYGELVVSLSAEQRQSLTDVVLGREFLKNLTSQFAIKLEVKRFQNGESAITISGVKTLRLAIRLTIMDWLRRPVEERSRFITFPLPKAKHDLLNLLTAKLKELRQDLGDPIKLYQMVQSLKADLRNFQRSSKGGKKGNSRRARVAEKLAESQCKLNMILLGQMKTRKKGRHSKSYNFLHATLFTISKPEYGQVPSSVYLKIIHHYNIIFAAYTPRNLPKLLDLYSRRSKLKPSQMKTQPATPKKDSVYSNFIKSLNKADKKWYINPSASSTIANNTYDQISLQNINNDRVEGFDLSKNYSGVESQFIMPETNETFDFNFDYPPPLMSCDVKTPRQTTLQQQNNYYNQRYDFGGNYSSRRQEDKTPVQQNTDFISLETYGSQNNHYNVDRDLADFNRKARGRYTGVRDHRINEPTEYGFADYPEASNWNHSLVGRNRWDNSYAARDVSSQDLFTSDTRGESSHKYFDSDELEVLSRNQINNREISDVNDPSISDLPDNSVPVIEQGKIRNSSKSKKKGKTKGTNLPLYLQKRAEKNIAKYVDLGFPRITHAAKQLQKKLVNKDLTLKCIKKFEGLVKRKLSKPDCLL